MPRVLHLNLKGCYFDAIKNGEKLEEYRLLNPFWKKRLVGVEYLEVRIKRGYPKADDKDKIIRCKWNGYRVIKNYTHEHFGDQPVDVFAIDVSEKING